MKLEKEKPFEDYTCYLNFNKGQGRWQVTMVDKDRNYKCYLYSKYLMSVKMGRVLKEEEQVDHINGDKADDRLSNLEVVTKQENERRWRNSVKSKWVKLICPICNESFERLEKDVRYKRKHKTKVYCSRACLYESMRK